MKRRLRDSVVVVTGASSGIGRATALAFAREGATVAVAARRATPLRDVSDECTRLGGVGLAVPTDIRDVAAVSTLVETTLEHFGRIDVWVNNAAVTMFAWFGEEPVDDLRRVVDTNITGSLLAARAALACFREQGSGTLINVGSILGEIPVPYETAYVMSKFALRAMSDSIRGELRDAPDIHCCTVMPGSVDTPLFDHAANHTGRGVKPVPPLYGPERVAGAIVRCAGRPRRHVHVGRAVNLASLAHRLAPALTERVAAGQTRKHFTTDPVAATHGNLAVPMAAGDSVTGGWRGGTRPLAVAAVGLLAAAASARLVGGRRDHR